jgi:hypothetical protein
LPPPPDEELEVLELLEPPPPPPPDDDDVDELDGAEDDELEDDVLDVLGAGAGELEELLELPRVELAASVGEVTPLLSHPIVAASPRVMAPPLKRRRKSRRSVRALSASFSSIFRSLWSVMTV